ncbi:MAG: class I SAM-dependent methyltransferase [Pseudomonadales bacterium]|nr:class I SAM-dependent methyltransferase [Pseudomonadales bacterium]
MWSFTVPVPSPENIALAFSGKYDKSHAEHYLSKHQATLASRLSHWRDVQLARKALHMAGDPDLVLDLPCGAGRFWPMLAEQPSRVIIGSDNSSNMIATAMQSQPAHVVSRVRPLQTSAFDINLPDQSVDSIFCMRLIHHVGDPAHRAKMLREFHRVTRDTVIISLWVDGNYKAWRRQKLEAKRAARRKETGYQNRFVLPAGQVESEFEQAGFSVVGSLDFIPFYAMWRVYVLRKNSAAV